MYGRVKTKACHMRVRPLWFCGPALVLQALNSRRQSMRGPRLSVLARERVGRPPRSKRDLLTFPPSASCALPCPAPARATAAPCLQARHGRRLHVHLTLDDARARDPGRGALAARAGRPQLLPPRRAALPHKMRPAPAGYVGSCSPLRAEVPPACVQK